MTLVELTDEVRTIINSCQYSTDNDSIITYINEGLQLVAGLIRIHGMQANQTVAVTSTGTLPSDRDSHDVFLVELNTSARTKLNKHDTYSSFANERRKLLTTGTPTDYYTIGNTIHVCPTPSSSTDLNIYYHTLPATLSSATDVPEGIEAYLHSLILTNYAASKIFLLNNDDKKNALHEKLFYSGVQQVKVDELPDEEDIVYVTDDGDYIL